MRVLLLTTDPPTSKHVNGGSTRVFQLNRRLVELGHEVTVIAPFPNNGIDYVSDLAQYGIKAEGYRRPASRVKETLSAVLRKPSLLFQALHDVHNGLIGGVYGVDLKPVIDRVTAEQDFDVVVFEQEFAVMWSALFKKLPPAVVVNQQVMSAYAIDRANKRSGPTRWWLLEEARRAKRFERRWAPKMDAVVYMSQEESDLIDEVVGKKLNSYVVGNGADFEWLADLPPDPGKKGVLFTGTMEFAPNVFAADWLAREVMPLLLKKDPEATLAIVGRNPGPATQKLDELPGVSMHASVPDMKKYFAEASVCTLPMLEGGGTRLKLAEAMAARRAVVATTNGATGVSVTDGEDIVIADGAEAFATAIAELLADDERRARIASAGYETASAQLDWKKLGEKWAAVLEETVAGAKR